jgi:hypothetical protein
MGLDGLELILDNDAGVTRLDECIVHNTNKQCTQMEQKADTTEDENLIHELSNVRIFVLCR